MEVKERILEFCDFMKIRPTRFERMCGLSNGYLNKLRHEPSREKLEAIFAVFPQLNKQWLLTGIGNMLLPSNVTTNNISTTRGNAIVGNVDGGMIAGGNISSVNITLPPQGFQKIIKSDGSQTTVEVATTNGECEIPKEVADELAFLRKENGDLKNKIIELQGRLLEGK